jgi:hypothetical protein
MLSSKTVKRLCDATAELSDESIEGSDLTSAFGGMMLKDATSISDYKLCISFV